MKSAIENKCFYKNTNFEEEKIVLFYIVTYPLYLQ